MIRVTFSSWWLVLEASDAFVINRQAAEMKLWFVYLLVLWRWANNLKSFHVFNFFNHSMDFIHRKYCSEFCRGRNVYTKLQSNFSRISIYAVFIRHLSVVKCVVVQIVSVDVRIYYHVVSKSYSLSWSFYFVFKLQTNLQCC